MSAQIRRVEDDHAVVFEIHEGRKYMTGEPRSTLDVEVWRPRRGIAARVSWPSTSDKRPELARALAGALLLAADEADRLNAASPSQDGTEAAR